MTKYIVLFLFSVFISAVSQVMLKKAAMRSYDSFLKEYLNPLVVVAYALFFLTTLFGVVCYKVIPVSLGPVLEATSYFYVTAFGAFMFHEKLSVKKVVALFLIVAGIVVYAVWG